MTNLKDLLISEESWDDPVPPPAWVEFMVGMGWWLRALAETQDLRVISTILLPTRSSSSLLAAFGSMLAGAQLFVSELDWLSLKRLPPGTEIFRQGRSTTQRNLREQVHGVVRGPVTLSEFPNQEFIGIDFDDGKYYVSVNHLEQFQFTLQPLSGRARQSLQAHERLYRSLVRKCDAHWFIDSKLECVLVGERSTLIDHGKKIALEHQVGRPLKFSLLQVLGLDLPETSPQAKVRLVPTRHLTDQQVHAPMCVLDGRAAFLSIEHCLEITQARSVVVILDRAEYDEQARDIVSAWCSSSLAVPDPPNDRLSALLPAGVECCIAALPR